MNRPFPGNDCSTRVGYLARYCTAGFDFALTRSSSAAMRRRVVCVRAILEVWLRATVPLDGCRRPLLFCGEL